MEAILAQRFGADAPWLKQATDGVELLVQQCLDQLASSPGPSGNALPIGAGSDYHHRARTAQELKQAPAADERQVSAAKGDWQTMDDVGAVDSRGELADPLAKVAPPPQPKKPQGWIL